MTEHLTSEMPRAPVGGPSLWRGADLAGTDRWVKHLSPVALQEIDEAMRAVKARRIAPPHFGKDDFQLGAAKAELQAILDELEGGRGFAIVRGLPIQRYDVHEAEIIFWGLGAHMGHALPQNADGHLLGHVKNLDLDISNTNVRGYQTTVQLVYHNDQSDVLGLMCIRPAKSGGESSLASVTAINNEMLERCPDLLRELYQPFYVDRRGELGREDEGDDPYYVMPILTYHRGLVSARYTSGYIRTAQRFPEVPRLTESQLAALETFDSIAKRDDMHLSFTMQAGDMQFANNYCILHSRTSFEDYPEPERRRHLLRLWLAIPNSRPLHPAFRKRFGSIEPGAIRGGIAPRRKDISVPAQQWKVEWV